MNLWHDIESGDNPPKRLNAIVEIPKGSRVKYELDKKTGLICVDRILSTSMKYPLNYGFIPQTYCDDKDPLDVLILCSEPIISGSLIKIRPISGLEMIDNGERDDKIIAVHADDTALAHLKKEHLSEHFFLEIKHFFEQYKKLENKEVTIKKIFEEQETLEIIKTSIEDYKKIRNQLLKD